MRFRQPSLVDQERRLGAERGGTPQVTSLDCVLRCEVHNANKFIGVVEVPLTVRLPHVRLIASYSALHPAQGSGQRPATCGPKPVSFVC